MCPSKRTTDLASATLLLLPPIAAVRKGVQKKVAMAGRMEFLKTCSSLLPCVPFTREGSGATLPYSWDCMARTPR